MSSTQQEKRSGAGAITFNDRATPSAAAHHSQAEGQQTPNAIGHSEDMDQRGQAAIEGREPDRPASNRRAIGIMFGIDPKNLYETPDDEQSRDQAVRNLD